MKRVFGRVEAVFDLCYLAAAAVMGLVLLCTAGADSVRRLAGVMALVLAFGDAFHLCPRVGVIFTGDGGRFAAALGRGKQVTSVTMTVFYVLLWHIGLLRFPAVPPAATAVLYGLAAVRIVLCLLPQNRWEAESPPVGWGVARNVPFLLQGLLVAGLYWQNGGAQPALSWLWLAILLSFACYLPVVLWSHRNRRLGMLMLPKTCMYLWMIAMFLSHNGAMGGR